MLEFLFICFLLLKSRKSPDKILRNEILETPVDFKNVIDSSFYAQDLWDELRKVCHPDRFGGDDKKIKIANEIQTSVNEQRSNLKALLELKLRAENELGVKFKSN